MIFSHWVSGCFVSHIIVAINKYQVMGYDECIDYIFNNSAIVLSEKDKLLKFDF